MSIAILGTGQVAARLAELLLRAGISPIIGSRSPGTPVCGLTSVDHRTAIAGASHIVLAIPFTAVSSLIASFPGAWSGKILIDCTNPLASDWSPLELGADASAAEYLARTAPSARVVKAFNMVFADAMAPDRLQRGGFRATTFIASDHPDAAADVAHWADRCGFDAVIAGPLRISRYLEGMAHLNIQIAVRQGGSTRAAFVYARE